MIVRHYCVTPPTSVDSCRTVQVIALRSNHKKYLKMKLFNQCDGSSAEVSPAVNTPYTVTSQTVYTPTCTSNNCDNYTVSTISYNGTFYYTVEKPDGTIMQTGDLTLLSNNLFNMTVNGLNKGKYYLTIHYTTDYSDNIYSFPLIVSG